MLKQACSVTSPLGAQSRREDLTEKLSESEKLVKEMSQTWEEKLLKTGRYLTLLFIPVQFIIYLLHGNQD